VWLLLFRLIERRSKGGLPHNRLGSDITVRACSFSEVMADFEAERHYGVLKDSARLNAFSSRAINIFNDCGE
jgi:hypothetical protein